MFKLFYKNDRISHKKIISVKSVFISMMVLFVFLFISLLLISGIFCKPDYLKPWNEKYSDQFSDPRIKLAAHGLLAANGHNMQPWKIRLDKDNINVFYLYADKNRVTKEVDPYARQMMVSQGTFLEYVSVAGEKLGYKTEVELFPGGNYEESVLYESMGTYPVAKITIREENTSQESQNSDTAGLYDYIFQPDTNRGDYQEDLLTEEEIGQLEGINTDSSLQINIYQDEENRDKLSNLVLEGAYVESGVERVMEEAEIIFRSNEYQKNKYGYGFSIEGQGTGGLTKHLLQGILTLFPSFNTGESYKKTYQSSAKQAVEHTYSYILITSRDNSRENQVKSGMLYSRLILKAHSLGLVMQPLSQPLEEYPEMGNIYQEIHKIYANDGSTIQMLIRIGKPTMEVPKSIRQEVSKIIEG